MNLHICLFVFVLNVLGSRAAPYIDAYINPERSEFNSGAALNPGTDFQMGNWTMDYNDTSDFEVEISSSPELLERIPGQTATVTVKDEMELFLFMPAEEDVCYIKDMNDFEDDKGKKNMVMRRDDCNDTNDTLIPKQINLSLPEKCRSLPVKWLDEFYCYNNINPDNPDIIKALRPFPGHKRFCTYESETVRTQTCYCWSCGNPLIKKKTLVCLRSMQINSSLKCKREITSYQSDRDYIVTEETNNDRLYVSAD
ncbi:uncharacterized protein LOC110456305 [Mizuhopecten yessoensis]|uniref:Uncharacterized protein n=1 Tax=Mizuhopecten yessoensis TaxID=6573 RepID=A0A210QB88_MIZYE|nr:uncharacterized protein LOC110456305 [Mizuhopecten yessoensis]OWF46000.1 hypothetical protein KP79_PYT22361 [Mizuhopecten yessoensis]